MPTSARVLPTSSSVLTAPVTARSATATYPICEKRGTTSRATKIQAVPGADRTRPASQPKGSRPPSHSPAASRCTIWLIRWTSLATPRPSTACPTQPRLTNSKKESTRIAGIRQRTLGVRQTPNARTTNTRCQHHTRPKLVPNSTLVIVSGSSAVAPEPAILAVVASSRLSADTSTTIAPTVVTRQNQASKVARVLAEVVVVSTPSP